jgi:Carboxypeptidase regulatory-like domain
VLPALVAAAVLAQIHGEALSFRCDAGDPRREVPCRVCLAPDSDAPLVCAASGEIASPPPGRYAVRAEAAGLALASNETLAVRPSTGRTRSVLLRLVPGGRVVVSAPEGVGRVEIFNLASGRREGVRFPRDLGTPIPIPAGPVVGLAFARDDVTRAVSRPADVPAGADARIDFTPPEAGHADLVARLEYAENASPARRDARVVAANAGNSRGADVESAKGVSPHLSLFYGLRPGRWTAEVRSESWSGEPVAVDLAGGATASVRMAPLVPRPTLDVVLSLDADLENESRRVSLHRCAPGEWASSGALDPDRCPAAGASREAHAVFAGLEARWHVLELDIAGRRLRRAVDLRSGTNQEERVEIRATRLTGRVLRGKRGVAADLELESLENPDTPLVVRAGPDGTFRASLWPQGSWLARVLPSRMDAGDAAFFTVDAPKAGALVRDFELPPTELRVGLVDARTKDPLPGASVAFLAYGKPRWRDADASGEVRVSGVPPGTLEVHAEAEGYRARQAGLEVEDSSAVQSFSVELTPLDRGNEFQARLPSGGAASLARVFVGTSVSGVERERVDCDSEGVCHLGDRPAEFEGMVLAHPDAGFTVLSAGSVLAAGEARLLPSGGILRLLPKRGEATADSLLQVSVAIPGATLPPTWLDNLAFAIGRPARTAVFPGALSGFFLPGLPAGPVVVTVTAALRDEAGGFGPPSAVGEPVALELPLAGAVEIELP